MPWAPKALGPALGTHGLMEPLATVTSMIISGSTKLPSALVSQYLYYEVKDKNTGITLLIFMYM